MEAHFAQWQTLCQEIEHGALAFMRSEYVHLLYRFALQVLRCMFESPREAVAQCDFAGRAAAHFDGYPRYQSELAYLDSVYKGAWEPHVLREDARFLATFTTNQVVLSRYGAQVLRLFLEKNHLNLVLALLLGSGQRRAVLVGDSLPLENYIGRAALTAEGAARDAQRFVREQYNVGIPREHFNMLSRLEDLGWRRRNPGARGGATGVAEKFPLEKPAATLLTAVPDWKNKFLVDFARDYVARLDPTSETCVMALRLRDATESVTVVELDAFFRLVVLGFESGECRVVYFSEDSREEGKEDYARENRRLVLGADLLKDSEQLANHLTAANCRGFAPALSLGTTAVHCVGHCGVVTALSLAYDAFCFLSAAADATVRLWNCRTGICVAVYRAHVRTVLCLRFAPRGFHFASGGSERVAFLWTTLQAQPLKRFVGHSAELTHVAFTRNLIYLVTAAADRTVRFWNVDDGAEVRVFYFEEQIAAVELSETGDTLAVGDRRGQLILWSVESYSLIARVELDAREGVRGLRLSYDESHILAHTRRVVAIYDFRRLRQPRSKDVYCKLEGGDEAAERPQSVWRADAESDAVAAAFTHRNVAVCVFREIEF